MNGMRYNSMVMNESVISTEDIESLAREYLNLGVPLEQLGLLIPEFAPGEHQQPQG
jgi:hypothetical protein